MIKLKNSKLLTYIQMKETLVNQGRKISEEIEDLEGKIKKCEEKEKEVTAKVEPKELGEQAEALKEEINKKIKEFEAIAEKIKTEKLNAIPKDLEKKHKDLMLEREKKERERNKLALKIQKIKDRIVPIIQKEVKPQLKKYEDLETVVVEKGEIVVRTFNHRDEWEKQWEKRNP